jgi:hypothetical protein
VAETLVSVTLFTTGLGPVCFNFDENIGQVENGEDACQDHKERGRMQFLQDSQTMGIELSVV